ncbi:MAG: shikimate dehydrogenase [Bryobacteraceae bacterium]|jgi:3-dehydroquinate dehydratase/shikimate dehydrogenase
MLFTRSMPQRITLPRICIALGFPEVETLLAHARKEYDAGERFFEFRLDYLPSPEQGIVAMRKFLSRHADCTILATCRRHQNHGRYNGSVEEQVRILDAAIKGGAKAVDIEIESAENCVERLESLRTHAYLLLSYHNYGGTPALESVLRRMTRISADGYKVVTTARKPSDNYRVLALARSHPKTPTIVLAMGETGFATRVLSTAQGGLYTYAAPNASTGTAAGQICARQLRHLYRVERFTKDARVYGIIADPVRHSISPAVHNRAFQARRVDSVYLPFLVKPAQLKDFLVLADKLPLAGFSVTIPHKQRILRYLDIVDPLARRIGAVNTVWRKAGKWRGTNTDAEGVVTPLQRRVRLGKASVLVVGNGGAARGAAFAVAAAGARLAITGRNLDRVRALAKACDAEPVSREHAQTRMFDVLIHATPLGMYPKIDQCFFEDRIPGQLVFDMVYNPIETTLVRRAREQGATVIPGLEMFLEQASRQFEIWTGETAPRAVMEKAALEALAPTQAAGA